MPLTLLGLLKGGLVSAWKPSGYRLEKRGFYYSPLWMKVRNGLRGRGLQNRDEPEADVDLGAKDLSPLGLLDGLVETFVAGFPRNHLVRPQGYAMDPPFRRMWAPHAAVVEMRTRDTRTFGFFVRKDLFVAMRLDLADSVHDHPELYEEHAKMVERLLARMSSSDVDVSSSVDDLIGDDLR